MLCRQIFYYFHHSAQQQCRVQQTTSIVFVSRKIFAEEVYTDRAPIETNAACLCYIHLAEMILYRFIEGQTARSLKVANVYDEGTFNDFFIE